jgi:hypothetical protein
MVIAAFVCFILLIVGWFIAPSSTKQGASEATAKPTDLKATVTP